MAAQTTPRTPADRARKQVKRKYTAASRVPVEIKGAKGNVTVTILPVEEWGYAYRKHFAIGDFPRLVEDIVDEKDWDKIDGIRPTTLQVAKMLETWGEMTGESAGESRASRAS